MRRSRPIRFLFGLTGTLALAAAGHAIHPSPAAADDYAFHVSYRAYLSGMRVGSGDLVGHLDGADYRLNATGEVNGIARIFSSYQGKSEARGTLPDGAARFRADSQGGGDARSVRMRFDGKKVESVEIEPEPEAHRREHPERVQLTGEHLRGVIDPLRALVLTGGYDGETFNSAACERTLPVFSGESRFDLALSFRSIETVASPRSNGYSGPVMVCNASYAPVAGHRNDHSAVTYLRDDARIEVTFAPLPDSDLLLPYRISVSTPFGPAVLQSQTFIGKGSYAAFAGGTD